MLRRYQTANVAAEKLRALSALAYAREPYLLQRTLRLSLSPLVRSQDTVHVVALVANNPAGTALAWEFFRDNYRVFYERYGGGHFLIESLIKAVTTHFSTEAKLAEVNQFFKGTPHDTDGTHDTLANACGAVCVCRVCVCRVWGGQITLWRAGRGPLSSRWRRSSTASTGWPPTWRLLPPG
jgi:hypothetical protein